MITCKSIETSLNVPSTCILLLLFFFSYNEAFNLFTVYRVKQVPKGIRVPRQQSGKHRTPELKKQGTGGL